ncbi:NDR1/HIN1-like protein 13 isoform X2 [Tasmannia lanceolata]|uniref:NDR1/HIN1-like protein 13 isoform X2 n=1 Tax=Tasmannia lanceolata TaxID=3420 RepID=UPI004062D3EF
MADRIHPARAGNSSHQPKKSNLAPGTYVIQIPKDQIYRIPLPENDHRHKTGGRNSCCCFCLSWICCLFFLILLLIALASTFFYVIFRPKLPNYSINTLSVKPFNLTSTDPTLSPEFHVAVRADNPNKNIGIFYVDGSSVTVSYSNVVLCNGVLPAFYQGTNNVTVFKTVLTGSGIRLSSVVRSTLVGEQKIGRIPLDLDLDFLVRMKVGAVKTWTVTVKVSCDLTVDKLTVNSKIVSKVCKVKL